MPGTRRKPSVSLRVEWLEDRQTPSVTPLTQSFDTTPVGRLPSGWSQWSSTGAATFAVSAQRAVSGTQSLATTTSSGWTTAQAWLTTWQPADVAVSADVYFANATPVQVLARGSDMASATPSYYAVQVARGLYAQLVLVQGGNTTVLATVNQASGFLTGQWARVTLSLSGNVVRAQLERLDTGQYLNAAGAWQTAATWAMTVTDQAITGSGDVGIARPSTYAGPIYLDDFTVTPLTQVTETFETTPVGRLPSGWSQWSSTGAATFAVSAQRAVSGTQSLATTTSSNWTTARAWMTTWQPADVAVSADVYLANATPVQVLARGSDLAGATPSYYAVQVARGLYAQLVLVQGGNTTVLATVNQASGFLTGQWARVTLSLSGNAVQAQIQRLDTGQYLNAEGAWQTATAWAMTVTNQAITGSGDVGIARPSTYAGSIFLDDFTVGPASDTVPPTVALVVPPPLATLSGVVTLQARASDNVGVTRVDFYADGNLLGADSMSPYTWSLDTTALSNGTHQIAVRAYDLAGNSASVAILVSVSNFIAPPEPWLPQHYSWIRVAELAYDPSQLDSVGTSLLANSVDLVVTQPSSTAAPVSAAAPNVTQLLYTNVSNLYGSLLTSWDAYADANDISRESAFYHVQKATAYSGTSPSSLPVNWFWYVARDGTAPQNLTAVANGTTGQTFALGGSAGDSVYLGYPELFREINIAVATSPGAGWSEQIEYPTAVNASGIPTSWARLPLLGDDTKGLHVSGRIWFDPPDDWVPASINGSAPMYYVRIRTLTTGAAPTLSSVLGRDYTGANGGTSGVIPAFDTSADLNHDGYLDDAEYANRKPGMNARFLYESRALTGTYGEMRFATNPSSASFRTWAIGYIQGLLQGKPASLGVMIDNSTGIAPVAAGTVRESVATFQADYATLLNAISQAVAPHVVMTNTASNQIVDNTTGAFEEFAFAALSDTRQDFESVANLVATQLALRSPSPYLVLDSMPTGGSPTDPRTQMATLAYYYLIANPTRTFIDFFGGSATSTSWSQHWVQAAAYNIGQPLGTWGVFATGRDPEDTTKTYEIFQRSYSNALVLYKPLSYGPSGAGTLDNATATTQALPGSYRLLNADGTLGSVITSITLRNGEGAVLIKV